MGHVEHRWLDTNEARRSTCSNCSCLGRMGCGFNRTIAAVLYVALGRNGMDKGTRLSTLEQLPREYILPVPVSYFFVDIFENLARFLQLQLIRYQDNSRYTTAAASCHALFVAEHDTTRVSA